MNSATIKIKSVSSGISRTRIYTITSNSTLPIVNINFNTLTKKLTIITEEQLPNPIEITEHKTEEEQLPKSSESQFSGDETLSPISLPETPDSQRPETMSE